MFLYVLNLQLEHEREGDGEEIESQIKWKNE